MNSSMPIRVKPPINDIAEFSHGTMDRIREADATAERVQLAVSAQIAWNVANDLIQTLEKHADCKTAVRILSRQLRTYELEAENNGIQIYYDANKPAPPPPMSEVIWAAFVCVTGFLGFVGGALVMRWMMMGAW